MSLPPAPRVREAPGTALTLLFALLADTQRAAVAESEERYRLLVEQSPQPIAVHQEGRLVFANRAAAGLLGASGPAALLGRPVLELVAPRSRRAVLERVETLYATGEPQPFEERTLRGVDGRRVRAEVAAARVLWAGAPAIQILARDVTERRRAEALARRRAERVREAERLEALGRLAGGFAREFGALLAETVSGADELLGELALGSPHATRLRALRRSALRACRLADQLGSLAGPAGAAAEPVHLSALCAEAADALAAVASRAELSYDLAAALPPVRCDAARLRRALVDVVHLAARRAGTGGVAIRTGMRRLDAEAVARAHGCPHARPGSYVLLEVGDEGPPVSAAECRRLFLAFGRRAAPGAVLGGVLAAMRACGGLASAEGGRGRGLRVALLLPAWRERPAARSPRRAPALRGLPRP